MRSRFRDLGAYRLAAAFSDDVYRAAASWPGFEKWSLGMQVVRAADSIGANIAESSGRWHAPDKKRLLIIARGSLYETEHWLERAEARGLPLPPTDRMDELAWALSGLIRNPAPER